MCLAGRRCEPSRVDDYEPESSMALANCIAPSVSECEPELRFVPQRTTGVELMTGAAPMLPLATRDFHCYGP